MATDLWNGGDAAWDVAADWNGGLPASDANVLVSAGQVTATQSIGIVAGISVTGSGDFVAIDDAGGVAFGAVSVGAGAEFGLDLLHSEGGSTFAVGGALINHGLVQLGDDDLSLMSTDALSVGSLDNIGGTIDLEGCSGMDPRAYATLDVTTGKAGFGALGVLEGQVSLASCALIEFASGQITKIAAKASLTLDGYYVYIADAADSTSDSALLGLDNIAGTLDLAGGAGVVVSGSLANSGAIGIDSASGQGGSSLQIAKTLTNSGSIVLGATDGSLSGSDVLSVAALINDKVIALYGDGANWASLKVSGSLVNDGTIAITDDNELIAAAVSGTGGRFVLNSAASLEFAGSTGAGETVEFDNADADVVIDASSAFHATLSGLANGDVIYFSHLSDGGLTKGVSNATAHGFTLDLSGGGQSAALNFSGFAYNANDFQYSAFDGVKGLQVKFV